MERVVVSLLHNLYTPSRRMHGGSVVWLYMTLLQRFLWYKCDDNKWAGLLAGCFLCVQLLHDCMRHYLRVH